MSTQLISAIGYIIAAITVGLALYYWRRAASLYALLIEGANRFEELRKRGAQLELLVQKADEKAKQHGESTRRLTTAIEEARAKAAELTQRLEQKDHEGRMRVEKVELQKGHLERQMTKLQEALQAAEDKQLTAAGQAQQLQQDLHKLRGAAQEEVAMLRQELTLREKDWQAQMIDAQRLHAATEKQAKAGDPVEMRRLKRKIVQYDRLYGIMRGQREMSEERNRNWEVALERLATWILEEKGVRQPPKALGPRVGEALRLIGAQLIDDHEIMAPREGGEGAMHMDLEGGAFDAEHAADLDAER